MSAADSAPAGDLRLPAAFSNVTLVDVGIGNMPNVARALARAGAAVSLARRADDIAAAGRIVLPGVGAFPAAMAELRRRGLDVALRDAAARGAAILGICLGMQLLFDESEEFGVTAGLGLLPGRVVPLAAGVAVPHVGWNRLQIARPHELFAGMADGEHAYFVHSFHAVPARGEDILATTVHGGEIVAAAGHGLVAGVQFHPEKSGDAGARLLARFLTLAPDVREPA